MVSLVGSRARSEPISRAREMGEPSRARLGSFPPPTPKLYILVNFSPKKSYFDFSQPILVF
jgi:hypothetical protein